MSRTRIHYPNMAVAVANGASFDDSKGSMKNLDRVQALSFNVEANRQQPTEVGSFGFVANQVMQSPDVNLEIEYLLSDGDNERNLDGIGLSRKEKTNALRFQKNFSSLSAESQQNVIEYMERGLEISARLKDMGVKNPEQGFGLLFNLNT